MVLRRGGRIRVQRPAATQRACCRGCASEPNNSPARTAELATVSTKQRLNILTVMWILTYESLAQPELRSNTCVQRLNLKQISLLL